MPTVLDSLIIEIGLDPTKFTKGQKEAIKSFNEAAEAAKKAAGSIEASSSRSAEFLGKLNTQLMAFGALVAGSKITGDILQFAANVTKQDAATGRLAYTLETGVHGLDKWRNAAYLAGGTSEGVTGFIQNLTSEFSKFEIHGQSELVPYFKGLGVEISGADKKMRPFADIMRDVSNAVKKLGPAQGAEWLRSIGADPGSIALLIKGGDELDRYLKAAEQFSTVTPQNVENATKLDYAYRRLTLALTGLGRAAVELLSTPLIDMFDRTTRTAQEFSRGEFISKDSLLGSYLYGTKFRGFGTPDANSPGGGSGAFKSQGEKEAFIRAEAIKRGISPDIAMGVAKSEGFSDYVGDKGTSFGAFQLHYKNNIPGLSNGGLGDTFTKQTGKHASDPSTEREQIQFALDEAKKSGWGAWHGWKGSQWAGIDKGGGGSNSNTTIGQITINTQATDAQGIAGTIKPAIERSSQTYQGQGGVQ